MTVAFIAGIFLLVAACFGYGTYVRIRKKKGSLKG